jgi:hypothetical protein
MAPIKKLFPISIPATNMGGDHQQAKRFGECTNWMWQNFFRLSRRVDRIHQ